MKKKFIQLILFLFVAAAFAQSELPESLAKEIGYVYESVQSANGEWLFINAVCAADKKNRLYSFNTRTKESHILFEPCVDLEIRFISGMYFWERMERLYFQAHGGGIVVNGCDNMFLYNGIYVCQKSDGGGYEPKGVRRFSGVAEWLIKKLWKAYIAVPLQKNGQPDYDAFLAALYSFADGGSNPIFGVQKENGEFVYEKDAVLYIKENRLEEFLDEKRANYCFPLENICLPATPPET